MGMPMIIGAGVGALSSAAMGKSPFTGALLGGATGGAFGGAGSFGSGFTQGGLAPSLGLGATGSAVGSAAPTMAASEFISPFTPTGVAGTQLMNAGLTAPMSTGMMGQLSNYFQNPLNIGSAVTKAEGILSPNQPQTMMQPNVAPIRPSTYQQQTNPTPTAAATDVAPHILPSQKSKVGLVDLDTLLRKNPRAAQFAQSLIG
jgi:hypothetical protein